MELDPDRVDALAARVLDSGMAPALALAVTDADGIILGRTYGAASPGMLWPIASIGKSFTVVVALQLAEEGLLDLNVPITDYVPWLAVPSRFGPITLHHLLTHTGGVIEASDLAPGSTYDVIALTNTETGFPPGEHRHYSNVGYRAIGVILEQVSGRPYPDLVQERILDH